MVVEGSKLSEPEWDSDESQPVEERRANWQGLEGEYSEEHKAIVDWLMTVTRPLS